MSLQDGSTQLPAGGAKAGATRTDGSARGSGGHGPTAGTPGRGAAPSFVGQRLGVYLITKRLGAGGVGEVFKAIDVMLKREVAIKLLRDELTADPVFLRRFTNEAQLHAKLAHPNVASVHAFLRESDKQFMVMEYVAGIPLDEFVRAGGPVPVQRALEIFRRVLDGIEHVHRSGIVHRDIKPANIMLADNGQVKVMDFGIARALDSQEHLTRLGQVAGTVRSMAPEQIRGQQADVRSDIYALGIVLYTLLAGRAPFEGPSDHALMRAQLEQVPPALGGLVDNLSPTLESAVLRALEKDPAARFQSVRDFACAIDACVAEIATAVPRAADPVDDSTDSMTVINPALQGVQRLPPARVRGPVHEGPQPRVARWLQAGALAAIVGALGTGAILLWPPGTPSRAPSLAPAQPVGAGQSSEPAPGRDASVAAPRPVPAPAPVLAAIAPPPALPPAAAAVALPTLAIDRLPAAAGATAAVPGADTHRFKAGERIRLLVTPSQDAHVYCYLQDENHRIVRFYPNRFNANALVKAGSPLEIPGAMRFELVANRVQATEMVVCISSAQEVLARLPAAVAGTDFEALPIASLDEVEAAFALVAPDALARARFRIEAR